MNFSRKTLNINKYSYFYKLFSRIIFVVIGLIMFFMVTAYFLYSFFAEKISYDSNKQINAQIGYNVQSMRDTTEKFIANLSNNNNIIQLMHSKNMSLLEYKNKMENIYQVISANSFVHSIEIYNGENDNWFYIGNEFFIRKSDEMFDKGIVKLVSNNDINSNKQPFERIMTTTDYNPNLKKNVYSYILYDSYSDISSHKRLLVININANEFFKTLNTKEKENNFNDVMIISKEGVIVGNKNNDLFLKNISNEQYVKKILSNDSSNGNFVNTVDGHKMMVSYIKLEDYEWTVISTTLFSNINKTIYRMLLILFFVTLVLIGVGFIVSYFLSKNLYSPISMFLDKIDVEYSLRNNNFDKSDEFTKLDEQLQTIKSELSNFSIFQRKYSYTLRNETLRKLVYTNSTNENFSNELKAFNVNLSLDNCLIIILFRFDKFNKLYNNSQELGLLLDKYALCNIANEIISTNYQCESISDSDDFVLTIVNVDVGDDINEMNNKICNIAKEVQEAFLKYYKASVSAFVSEIAQNSAFLSNVYSDVINLSNYRIIFGHNCLLSFYDSPKQLISTQKVSRESMRLLLDNIKLAQLDAALEQYNQISKKLCETDYEYIRTTYTYLLTSIFNMLSELQEKSKVIVDVDFLVYFDKITKSETFEEVDSEFGFLIEKIINDLNKNKTGKVDKTMNGIIEYIKTNYSDVNLSSKTVSQIVGLSTRYAGKLFLDYYGRSIQQYIMEIRLENAAQMLVDTNLTVEEIIYKIGWLNVKYFFSMFKKQYAVTPTQYRIEKREIS